MSFFKKFILLTLITQNLWAKPLVIVAHFDPFGKSPVNNSTTVALEIAKTLQNDEEVEIALCQLSTAFDKAFPELENCIRAQTKEPSFVLGIGEAFCGLKIETLAKNRDHTFGPDNDGVERKNLKIIPTGEDFLGLSTTIEKMYCQLNKKEQSSVQISSDAGSFVCNNVVYQYSHFYPNDNFSFIHVPTSQCKNLESKNKKNIPLIIKMLKTGAKNFSNNKIPTTREEVLSERNSRKDACEKKFYKSLKRTAQ